MKILQGFNQTVDSLDSCSPSLPDRNEVEPATCDVKRHAGR